MLAQSRIINAKGFAKVSAEVYRNFAGDMGPAVRRVALLGGDVPRIKTLADFVALMNEGVDTAVAFAEQDARGGDYELLEELDMADAQKLQEQLDAVTAERKQLGDELAKVKGQLDKLNPQVGEIEKMSERLGKLETDLASASAQNKALVDRLNTTEGVLSAERQAAKAARIDKFCETQLAAGRITPAEMDAGLKAQLMRLDDTDVVKFGEGEAAKEATLLQNQLDLISARTPVVKFNESGTAGKGGPANAKIEAEDPVMGKKVMMDKGLLDHYNEHSEEYAKMGIGLAAVAKGEAFGKL